MAITKGNVELEHADFEFDSAGEVTGLKLEATYDYIEDGIPTVHMEKTLQVWDDLTPSQKAQASAIGKKLLALAKASI